MRVTISEGPPGGKVTSMRTGFTGHCCAPAACAAQSAAPVSARRIERGTCIPRFYCLRSLLGLRLVLGDRLLQVRELRAREEADLVERAQVLLGLRHVADLKIGLADVLVRAAVARIQAQRLVVVLEPEAHVGIGATAARTSTSARPILR